ncbi:MAG TPA: flagellar hook-basal body complex protein, partial [Acetobacteraceae bacterium]|nr:flagellar hook-basal body complex protein [Acetobacteraceae bacterium]
TGLQAQSYALDNISGNIANSQTTGFKRIDTSFEDLIPDTSLNQQAAGSVLAFSRATNNVQGDVQTMTVPTYMAINGSGYFTVEKPSGTVDSNPVFDGVDLYTRRGDFTLNAQGYLVNGAGYYLMGQPIDQSTNNPSGSVPETLQFSNDLLPAVATTQIQYRANLPAVPSTQDSSATVPDSDLIDPTAYSVNPLVAGTGTVVGTDVNTFLAQSISGGAITAYDSTGAATNVQLRWAKTANASTSSTDTWELFYQTNSTATGSQVGWQNAGTSFDFDSTGQMNPLVANQTLTNLTVDGTSLGNVALQFGSGGVTQFSDSNGSVKVNNITQNGFPAGSLQGVSINNDGRVVGAYTNGRTIDLAQISLATFNGEDFLKRMDGSTFAATDESGAAHYSGGGQIVGSALEASNTDISDEFSKLIVTQQAYSANTRIVTTSNEMLQDVMAMIR